MFVTLLILTVVLVGLVVLLPYWSKLVNYSYEPNQKSKARGRSGPSQLPQTSGYVPPDQQLQQETKAKATGLRKFTADDVPVKLKLNHLQTKRRKERLDVDRNPNNFDYDLDELINEVDEPISNSRTSNGESSVFSKDIV
ncbi:hypothetical protein CANTEDRAFT_105448 [Yamadazyma tenuis ATCC 10573]|uniref:Uncharacterized protein n=1 Tax=Candida tenuis (strain ATCC 10573 / BCRC 21748 / CBS 615 / JCM 9827 / NBRC 10315 / NRRL Y-1498 / VKM Y-70) TaxID=590646 RepID=G3B435_CANTC|nr:uncharacterized protein CANTEDRAFT_105448 [Yamadazyma tenuis ATCC 10573]EGV63764.1 hypothetical protein CANTEDRAFT_105448 [Yamadazyma tenuis ATCC 10573]